MTSLISVTLKEWEVVQPEPGSLLRGLYLDDPQVRRSANELTERGMLQITEGRHGIAVTATSFVGRVRLGNLTITIQPKIARSPLMRLLAYAYGLRDLERSGTGTAHFATDSNQPFHDLLIHQLALEVRELIARGLRRAYSRTERRLFSPKGQINVGQLAVEGVGGRFIQDGSLPCSVYELSGDTALNQVLRAGLILGARLTEDPALRATLRVLDNKMEVASVSAPSQRRTDIRANLKQVRLEQSRLTTAYAPALTLIELLNESTGPTLVDESDEPNGRSALLSGFLFDMNRFFQALLYRFLSENLPAPYSVYSERGLTNVFTYDPQWNPRKRRSPTPRPDFAITLEGKTVLFLDAKYRDLWEKSLPREMLYQLAIYAMSLNSNQPIRQAVILYPATTAMASESHILVREPTGTAPNPATVVLRPVNLMSLSELIHDRSRASKKSQTALAESLVLGKSTVP